MSLLLLLKGWLIILLLLFLLVIFYTEYVIYQLDDQFCIFLQEYIEIVHLNMITEV